MSTGPMDDMLIREANAQGPAAFWIQKASEIDADTTMNVLVLVYTKLSALYHDFDAKNAVEQRLRWNDRFDAAGNMEYSFQRAGIIPVLIKVGDELAKRVAAGKKTGR